MRDPLRRFGILRMDSIVIRRDIRRNYEKETGYG